MRTIDDMRADAENLRTVLRITGSDVPQHIRPLDDLEIALDALGLLVDDSCHETASPKFKVSVANDLIRRAQEGRDDH